ncbi:MAG: ATP-binding cassette domain-containing protein [Elusimicrobiales bacterium]|nr:ATP-binding cassette domain-containing protein [Elusimicrobiales bacterium]
MINIKGLTKIYDSKKVLDNIELEISENEIFTIMGPSGCGKSTLLKSIIRLIKPESGNIFIDNKNILSLNNELELLEIRKKFGYLFQDGALFDSLNVWENVTFGLKYLTNIPKEKYLDIAKEKLELVGLSGTEYKKINELSGGMKKRVALARAIAHNPKYILYDEPTTGLDPLTSEKIYELIIETSKKLKTTSIIVTHDIKLAFTVSTKIGILYRGKFIIIDEPIKIKNSQDPFVKEFIETSVIDSNYSEKVKYNL